MPTKRTSIKTGNKKTVIKTNNRGRKVVKGKTKSQGTKVTKTKTVSKNGDITKKIIKTKQKVRPSQQKIAKAQKIGTVVGGIVGGSATATASLKSHSKSYKFDNGEPAFKSGSLKTNAKGTIPSTYKPGGTNMTISRSKGKFTGSKGSDRAYAAIPTTMAGTAGAAAGNLAAKAIAKKRSTKRTKTKIVNGVNKTAAKQRVKSARQTIRAKKKSIRKR